MSYSLQPDRRSLAMLEGIEDRLVPARSSIASRSSRKSLRSRESPW